MQDTRQAGERKTKRELWYRIIVTNTDETQLANADELTIKRETTSTQYAGNQ